MLIKIKLKSGEELILPDPAPYLARPTKDYRLKKQNLKNPPAEGEPSGLSVKKLPTSKYG